MKIAITGTTSGIGQSTMELLESKGHEVFSINRPEWDHHDLDNLSKIDLKGQDVLVLNAGHNLGRLKFAQAEFDSWMNVMKVNQLAPMLLTETFMRDNPKGTIIYMTTHHDAGSSCGGAYHTAKYGLKFFINQMRDETKDYRFVDFSLGRIKTKMRENWKVPLDDDLKNWTGKWGNAISSESIASEVEHVILNENISEIYLKHPRR